MTELMREDLHTANAARWHFSRNGDMSVPVTRNQRIRTWRQSKRARGVRSAYKIHPRRSPRSGKSRHTSHVATRYFPRCVPRYTLWRSTVQGAGYQFAREINALPSARLDRCPPREILAGVWKKYFPNKKYHRHAVMHIQWWLLGMRPDLACGNESLYLEASPGLNFELRFHPGKLFL